MALDKNIIGYRIRKIREDILKESRNAFARRCDLTERHIGQIERGEFLVSLHTLDLIASATWVDVDYILYGKTEDNRFYISKTLYNIINRSDKDELIMYYNCIRTIKNYINKKNKR